MAGDARTMWGAAMLTVDKKKNSGSPRIGELFVEAGLVKQQTVSECLLISKNTQLPLGRVLIMSGHVTEPDVDCAVQAQEMIKSGQVTRETAKRLVRMVHCNKVSIEEAQAMELFEKSFSMPFVQVGQLLFAAKILSEEVLSDATRRCALKQAPLGKFLADEGLISEDLLISALNCIIFVRDHLMTRSDAVSVLRSVHLNGTADLASALQEHCFDHLLEIGTPRLLDFLSASSIIENRDVTYILEMALESGWQTGQVLLLNNLVNEAVLSAALQLQAMLTQGSIKLARASELLWLCKEMNAELETMLAELDKLNQVVAFLRRGEIFDERQIREIAAVTPDFEACAGSTLVREGVINHEMLTKAVRCLAYFRSGALTEQQALTVYNHSIEMHISPEEAHARINWDLNNRYGSSELLGKTA
jgi:hypothetical protein